MFFIYANDKLIYRPMDDSLIILNPKLKLEMGKSGSLEFKIMPSHPYYAQLNQLTTVVYVMMDDEEIFRGRVLSNKLTFDTGREIYCEGNLSYLVDSVIRAQKFEGKLYDFFQAVISEHNGVIEDEEKQFTVGRLTVDNRDIKILGKNAKNVNVGNFDIKQIAIESMADNYYTAWDYLNNTLIDREGGYLKTRYENGTQYIDYVKSYDGTATQEIELGKNLLDLEQEVNSDELFTVLIPLGDNNLTIEKVNGNSDELVDEDGVALYGRIIRTQTFSNVTSPRTLLENAQRYMASKRNIPTTLTVKAIDLHLIDPNVTAIRLGDRVHITSLPHSLLEYLTCTEIEYDITNPANNTYVFGNPQQTLTERYRENVRMSGYSYGSGGVAETVSNAAEKTEEKKEEKTEEKIKNLYNIIMNGDPVAGTLGLKVVSQDTAKTREALTEIGLDIDAPDGTLNLTNIKRDVDANKNLLETHSASIQLLQEETGPAINLVAQEVSQLKEDEAAHVAQLRVAIVNQQSIIEGKADQIAFTAKTAEINADIIRLQGQIDTLKATNAEIDNLVSQRIEAKLGSANTIVARNIYATRNMQLNDVTVSTQNHSHFITEEIVNGVPTGRMTLGYATVNGGKQQNFNIADTRTYKEGVSAAAASVIIKSISVDGDITGNRRYDDETGKYRYYLNVPVVAKTGLADGSNITDYEAKTKTESLVKLSDEVYNEITGFVTVNGVEYARFSEDNSTDYGRVNITLSNRQTPYTVPINPNAYQLGATTGYSNCWDNLSMGFTPSQSQSTPNLADIDVMNSQNQKKSYRINLNAPTFTSRQDHQYDVFVKVTNAEGATIASRTFITDISAYNDGVDAGASTAVLNTISLGTAGAATETQTGVYRADIPITYTTKGTKSGTGNYYISTSQTTSASADVTAVYEGAYKNGKNVGLYSASVSSVAQKAETTPTHVTSGINHYVEATMVGKVGGTLSDGSSYESSGNDISSVRINANAVWNDSARAVTIPSDNLNYIKAYADATLRSETVGGAVTYKLDVPIKAIAQTGLSSYSPEGTRTVPIDITQIRSGIYNTGFDAGLHSGSVSSIAQKAQTTPTHIVSGINHYIEATMVGKVGGTNSDSTSYESAGNDISSVRINANAVWNDVAIQATGISVSQIAYDPTSTTRVNPTTTADITVNVTATNGATNSKTVELNLYDVWENGYRSGNTSGSSAGYDSGAADGINSVRINYLNSERNDQGVAITPSWLANSRQYVVPIEATMASSKKDSNNQLIQPDSFGKTVDTITFAPTEAIEAGARSITIPSNDLNYIKAYADATLRSETVGGAVTYKLDVPIKAIGQSSLINYSPEGTRTVPIDITQIRSGIYNTGFDAGLHSGSVSSIAQKAQTTPTHVVSGINHYVEATMVGKVGGTNSDSTAYESSGNDISSVRINANAVWNDSKSNTWANTTLSSGYTFPNDDSQTQYATVTASNTDSSLSNKTRKLEIEFGTIGKRDNNTKYYISVHLNDITDANNPVMIADANITTDNTVYVAGQTNAIANATVSGIQTGAVPGVKSFDFVSGNLVWYADVPVSTLISGQNSYSAYSNVQTDITAIVNAVTPNQITSVPATAVTGYPAVAIGTYTVENSGTENVKATITAPFNLEASHLNNSGASEYRFSSNNRDFAIDATALYQEAYTAGGENGGGGSPEVTHIVTELQPWLPRANDTGTAVNDIYYAEDEGVVIGYYKMTPYSLDTPMTENASYRYISMDASQPYEAGVNANIGTALATFRDENPKFRRYSVVPEHHKTLRRASYAMQVKNYQSYYSPMDGIEYGYENGDDQDYLLIPTLIEYKNTATAKTYKTIERTLEIAVSEIRSVLTVGSSYNIKSVTQRSGTIRQGPDPDYQEEQRFFVPVTVTYTEMASMTSTITKTSDHTLSLSKYDMDRLYAGVAPDPALATVKIESLTQYASTVAKGTKDGTEVFRIPVAVGYSVNDEIRTAYKSVAVDKSKFDPFYEIDATAVTINSLEYRSAANYPQRSGNNILVPATIGYSLNGSTATNTDKYLAIPSTAIDPLYSSGSSATIMTGLLREQLDGNGNYTRAEIAAYPGDDYPYGAVKQTFTFTATFNNIAAQSKTDTVTIAIPEALYNNIKNSGQSTDGMYTQAQVNQMLLQVTPARVAVMSTNSQAVGKNVSVGVYNAYGNLINSTWFNNVYVTDAYA